MPDQLTLAGERINFNTNGYKGSYTVNGATTLLTDDASAVLIPGVQGYTLQIAPGNAFKFNLTDDSSITVTDSKAASGLGRMLTFNTVTINVTPQGYAGYWYVTGASPKPMKSAGEVVLMRDVDAYILETSAGRYARFNVKANGDPNPTSVEVSDELTNHTFLLARKPSDSFHCEFAAKLKLLEALVDLPVGSTLNLTATFDAGDPKSFGKEQTHYSWTGSIEISDKDGEVLSSQQGGIYVLDGLPALTDNLAILLSALSGSLGDETPTQTTATLTLTGGNTVLDSSILPSDYSTWNLLDKTRVIAISLNGKTKGASVEEISPVGGACFH